MNVNEDIDHENDGFILDLLGMLGCSYKLLQANNLRITNVLVNYFFTFFNRNLIKLELKYLCY